jgi:hypothetical protein
MTKNQIRINAYGKPLLIERINEEWIAFYLGAEGKRRKAHDVVIPADLDHDGVVTYIADLMHESATDTHPNVRLAGTTHH